MYETPTRMEITPRVIDLGDRVIQLDHVASVRVGAVHPLRSLAHWPFVAACLLAIYDLIGREGGGNRAASLINGVTVLSMVLLALAAGCFWYRRRLLVISTSDSQSIWIRSTDPTVLRLVLEQIRSAMTARDPSFRVSIDLVAKTVETGQARDASQDLHAPPLHTARATPDRDWADHGPDPVLPTTLNGAVQETRSSFAEAMLREARARESADAPSSTSDTAPVKGRVELEAVIALIDRAELPHKTELHALLDPVRDHLAGGRTSRRDATHNWRLFHDYAQKYLADVDGLAESCRRVQATLQ